MRSQFQYYTDSWKFAKRTTNTKSQRQLTELSIPTPTLKPRTRLSEKKKTQKGMLFIYSYQSNFRNTLFKHPLRQRSFFQLLSSLSLIPSSTLVIFFQLSYIERAEIRRKQNDVVGELANCWIKALAIERVCSTATVVINSCIERTLICWSGMHRLASN